MSFAATIGLSRTIGEIHAIARRCNARNELARIAFAGERMLWCSVVTVHVARGRPSAVAVDALHSGLRQLRILLYVVSLLQLGASMAAL